MLEVDDPCFMMNEMARSAAAAGELDLLLSCIGMGADPDAFDGEQGMTCLMLAAAHARLQCLRELADRSETRIVDHEGRDALIHAAMRGHSYCATFLADRCDAGLVGADGRSALAWACIRGDKPLASLLLERSRHAFPKGAFPGPRPLDLARACGWIDLVERIQAMGRAGRERAELSASLGKPEEPPQGEAARSRL